MDVFGIINPRSTFVRTVGSKDREYLNSPEFSLESNKELESIKLSLKPQL